MQMLVKTPKIKDSSWHPNGQWSKWIYKKKQIRK